MDTIYDNDLFTVEKRKLQEQNKIEEKKNYSKSSIALIVRIICINVIAAIILVTYYLWLGSEATLESLKTSNMPQFIYIMYTVFSMVIANIITLLYLRPQQHSKPENLNTRDYSKLKFFIAIIIGIQGVSFWMNYLLTHLGIFKISNQFSFSESFLGNCLIVIYLAILAPILEELIYREYMLNNFGIKNIRYGILVSALLFGLSHVDIIQVGMTFCSGIIFGLIKWYYKDIKICICCHIIVNSVSIIIGVSEYIFDNYSILFAEMIFFSLFVIVSFGILIHNLATISNFLKIEEKDMNAFMEFVSTLKSISSFVILCGIYIVNIILYLIYR